MSGKKTNDLKNAFKALNVSEPLRLSKNGPSFTPPEGLHRQEEVPRNEGPQTERPRANQPQNKDPHFEVTLVEGASERKEVKIPQIFDLPQNEMAQREGTHAEHPQNEVAHDEPAPIEGPQNKVAQGEFPQLEIAQNEVPRSEKAKEKKARGAGTPNASTSGGSFFRLSDRAFSSPELQGISGDCLRLFLWMSSRAWRYLKSDGTLRASIGYIEEGTAMAHATISRCIKTLREEGLIALLETDYKRGNVWQVSPIAFAGSGPGDLPPRFELPRIEGAQNAPAAPSKRGSTSLELRGKEPQIEAEIRSLKKIQEISQEAASPLFARVAKIRSVEKQKSEREYLLALLETYTPGELELAVSFLEKNGILGTHEPCHSLFRYLASAADDVIKTATRGRVLHAVVTPKTEVEEDRTKEMSQEALAAFEAELSLEERESIINTYIEQEFTWGYVPSKSLVTRLAAVRWDTQRNSQRQNAQARAV
jgi:hypothetical protein